MVTLAFMLVGAAIGSAIGGTVAVLGVVISAAAIGAMVGAVLGSVVDAYLFAPDPVKVEGHKMGDITLQSAGEGQGICEPFGPNNRVGPQVLYVSNIRETTTVSSFHGESPVLMADGSSKKIRDVQVGDRVLSYRFPKWFKRWRKPCFCVDVVTKCFKNPNPKQVYEVRANDGRGYIVTGNHAVYLDNKWIQIKDAEVGAQFLSCGVGWTGEPVTIDKIELVNNSDAGDAVYNFSTKKTHNYFINNTLWHNFGGKGGGVSSTTYSYDCDIVLGLCHAPAGRRLPQQQGILPEASGVRRIWASSKLIYNAAGNPEATGTFEVWWRMDNYWYYNGAKAISRVHVSFRQVGAFTDFVVGTRLDLSGAHPADNLNSGTAWNSVWWEVTSQNDDIITVMSTNFYNWVWVFAPYWPAPDWAIAHVGHLWHQRPLANHAQDDIPPGYPHHVYYNAAGFRWQDSYDPDSAVSISGLTLGQEIPAWKAGLIDYAAWQEGDNDSSTKLPSITSVYGSNSPHFHDIATLDIQGFQLGDSGNAIPQFNVLLNEAGMVYDAGEEEWVHVKRTVDQVITTLLTSGGWAASEFDVSGIDATRGKNEVFGYAVSGPMTMAKKLQALMTYHDLRSRVIDDVFYFTDADIDTAAYNTTATVAELGCREEGEPPPDALTIADNANWNMPSEVVCTYYDINKDCQQGSEIAQKVNYDTFHSKSLTLPVVTNAGKARHTAQRILWESEQFRSMASLRLPPSRIDVRVNDKIVATNSSGESFKVRVLQVERGDNYLHEVMGVLEESRFESFGEDGDDSQGGGAGQIYQPPPMLWFVHSKTSLSYGGLTEPSIYIGQCTYVANATYNGSAILVSRDESSWTALDINGYECVLVRTALNASAEWLGDWHEPDLIDNSNTIRVEAYHGTLSSVTLLEMLSGQNRLILGLEEIGYQTATFIENNSAGRNVYDLTGLLRNIKGSSRDNTMDRHDAQEQGMVYNNAGEQQDLGEWTGSLTDIGQYIYIRIVPQGLAVADAPSFTIPEFGGESVRCLAPCNVGFHRVQTLLNNTLSTIADLPNIALAVGDLIVRFNRRSRGPVRLFSSSPVLQYPVWAKFTLDVMSDSSDSATVKRTIKHDERGGVYGTNYALHDGQFQIHYSAANQVTDFGSTQSSIRVQLRQNGDLILDGYVEDVEG